MNFINTQSYSNISNFQVLDNHIAFNDENNHLYINGYLLDEDNESYFFYDTYLCYHTKEGGTVFFNYINNTSFEIDVFFHKDTLFNNNFLTSKNFFKNEEGKWLSDLYLYQLNPFKEIKKYDYFIEGNFFREKDFILQIFLKRNVILKNMENDILWQYSLDKKGSMSVGLEIIKFLGIYKNNICFVLNNGLLVLDIYSGEEAHFISNGKILKGNAFQEDFKGFFGYDTILDISKGIIFNLNLYFYLEYDLNSNSNKNYFNSYRFKNEKNDSVLCLNNVGGYDDKYIYAFEGRDSNRFAVLDREKKEVIWSSELLQKGNEISYIIDMQISGNNIYILDSNHTLHIFEREE